MIDKNIIYNIVNNTNGSLLVTDNNNKIVYSNKHFEKTFGFKKEELFDKKPSILKSDVSCKNLYMDIKTTLKDEGHWQGEIWNKNKDGLIKPYWVIINEVRGKNNNLENYFAMYLDMNKKEEKKKSLYELVNYDELTGLANRLLLNKTLQKTCSFQNKEKSAILFIDIDDFKHINDTYGHITGDYLLKQVANLIKSTIREHDHVFRVSGDEFVICLNNIKNKEDINLYASRLINTFNKPIFYKNLKLQVSISIGISIYPDDSLSKEELLHFSDKAMYKVKKNGKNGFSFYKELTI